MNRTLVVIALWSFAIVFASESIAQSTPLGQLSPQAEACQSGEPAVPAVMRQTQTRLAPVLRHINGRRYTQIVPGLSRASFRCQVMGADLQFRELRYEPGSPGLELRAIRNEGAYVDRSCRGGHYAGTDIFQVLAATPGFRPLAATNGNFFSVQPRPSGTGPGFISNGMLWTRAPGGSAVLAPARVGGGTSLFIADRQGGHVLNIAVERCNQTEPCITLASSSRMARRARDNFTRRMSTVEFTRALEQAFPTMTLAAQLGMPLLQGYTTADGQPLRASNCAAAPAGTHDCRGRDHPAPARTVLCGRSDGSISLLAIPQAVLTELAVGLRPGGACQTDCTILFNLDGGGSTQLEYTSSNRPTISIDRDPQPCGRRRPVDHYFVFGQPLSEN